MKMRRSFKGPLKSRVATSQAIKNKSKPCPQLCGPNASAMIPAKPLLPKELTRLLQALPRIDLICPAS